MAKRDNPGARQDNSPTPPQDDVLRDDLRDEEGMRGRSHEDVRSVADEDDDEFEDTEDLEDDENDEGAG